MPFIGRSFDASTVPPEAPRDLIPAGKYVVQIINSSLRDVRNKPGNQFLELEMEIIDGEHARRRLYERLNLVNDNPKAVQIAEQRMASICFATNKLTVEDSDDLHFIPFWATVIQQQDRRNKDLPPGQPPFPANNFISKFEAMDEGGVPTGRPPAPAQSASSTSSAPTNYGAPQGGGGPGRANGGGGGTMPWGRR